MVNGRKMDNGMHAHTCTHAHTHRDRDVCIHSEGERERARERESERQRQSGLCACMNGEYRNVHTVRPFESELGGATCIAAERLRASNGAQKKKTTCLHVHTYVYMHT